MEQKRKTVWVVYFEVEVYWVGRKDKKRLD